MGRRRSASSRFACSLVGLLVAVSTGCGQGNLVAEGISSPTTVELDAGGDDAPDPVDEPEATTPVEEPAAPGSGADGSGDAGDEAEVRETFDRFVAEVLTFDERTAGPEAILPILDELTTGDQLARMTERAETHLDNGQRTVFSGYDPTVLDLTVVGDSASVLDCSAGTSTTFDASGAEIEVSEHQGLHQTWMVRSDDAWKIETYVLMSETPCDP